jgi:hypothetical protein
LGTTITIEALQAAADTPDQSAFYRAHLNCWVAAASSWLPLGVWDKTGTDHPMPSGGVLAVDSSLDDSRYVGVRAVPVADGVQVAVMFVCDSALAMWRAVQDAITDPSLRLALTPGLHAVSSPEIQRRSEVVGMAEQYTYTPIVRALILEDRLRHTPNQNLAEHVGRAVLARSQASMALSSQKSPGPIELARCLVWSAGLAAKPTSNVRKPMFASSQTRTP